jgi:hypothetical protein|eukprot:7382180-Prymnesium_polylepis.1
MDVCAFCNETYDGEADLQFCDECNKAFHTEAPCMDAVYGRCKLDLSCDILCLDCEKAKKKAKKATMFASPVEDVKKVASSTPVKKPDRYRGSS